MLKILFADDSMTAQNMGKKILTDAGYDVIAVSNGAAAAKKILEQPPDIAILDVHMPGYTGFEVCAKIRSAHETSKMPVLLTVGKMEPYSVEDGARVKADGVIIKPFEASVLLATVRNLAERLGPLPPESGTGYDATMRMEPPSFEEFKDDTYAAWKADTAQFETLTEAASHQPSPSTPEMANTPAYSFDETISIPPPVEEHHRETVPMETLSHASAHTSENVEEKMAAPGTPAFPTYSIDETQPIHPYVDPVEPVHQETQEFTAIFTPTDSGKISLSRPPAEPVIDEPAASLPPVEVASSAIPAATTMAPPPPPPPHETHETGKLETFEEFTDPIFIEPAPGFELTAQTAGDVEIKRDPEFEHTTAHHAVDVPVGNEPGLLTTGTESIELAHVKAAAFSHTEAPPEFDAPVVMEDFGHENAAHNHESAAQNIVAPEQPAIEPVVAAAAEKSAAEHEAESHDAAFEKLVSDLLSKEPAGAVEIAEMPPALEEPPPPEKPQSFFSRYLGFGKSPRPERSSTGTGSFIPTPAEETAQTQPISSETLQRAATPSTPTPSPVIAPPPPPPPVAVAEDAMISLESFDEKVPAKAPVSRTPETSRSTEAEPGSFTGIRDFKKVNAGAGDAPRTSSSVPFSGAAFEEPVKRKVEEPVKPAAAVSSVPPFSASFKEPVATPRKKEEVSAFEDLSFDTQAIPAEILAPAITATPVETPVVHEVVTPVVAAPITPAPVPPVVVAPPPPPVAAVPTPVIAAPIAPVPVVPVVATPAPIVVPEPEPEPEPHVVESAAPALEETENVHEISAEAMELAQEHELEPEAEPVIARNTGWQSAVVAQAAHEEPAEEAAETHAHVAIPEPAAVSVAEAAEEHIPVSASQHMADAELAEQLAAALEQHAHSVAAATPVPASSNGQSHAAVSLDSSAAVPGIDPSAVSMIITKVLDRMVPEIVRMIAHELEQERTKRVE